MKKINLLFPLIVLSLVACNTNNSDAEQPYKECEECEECKECEECEECKECEECEECHEHTYSATFSHDFDYHWKESTCGHTGLTSEFGEHTYNQSGVCSVCGAKKAMISISKQPESITVKLGSSVSFEVEVDNATYVRTYQWQILNLELPDENGPVLGLDLKPHGSLLGQEFWVDLDCDSARTNKLTIPGPSFYGEMDYRCVITDVRGTSVASNRCHYTLEDYEASDPYLSVGSYVVAAGQTLDLSTTPFGKGKVSLNSKGNEIKLENVNFDNERPDYDPCDSDVAFYFYCYDYQESNLSVNLVGDNKIDNKFFQEDSGAAGVSFGFYCGGLVKPQLTIGGEGTLTIIGGSHCIYTNTPLKVNADLTLKTQQKDHWTSGIHAKKITIQDNVKINADLTAYLFESNDKENAENGDLDVGEHAEIQATITPCQDGSGGSTLSSVSVITSSHSVTFGQYSKASIDVVFDVENLGMGMYLPPVDVISSNNNGNVILSDDSEVTIKGIGDNDYSNIYILGLSGISSDNEVRINTSKFTFIADLKNCFTVYGIVGKFVRFYAHSTVNVDISAYSVYAVASKGEFRNDGSSVSIKVTGSDPDNYIFGLVAEDDLYMSFDSTANLSLIGKGIVLGVRLGTGEEEKNYNTIPRTNNIKIDLGQIEFGYDVKYAYYSIPSVAGGYQYFEVPYNYKTIGEEYVLTTVVVREFD